MAYEMTQAVDKPIISVPDTNEHNANLFVLHLIPCPMFRIDIASLGHLRPFSGSLSNMIKIQRPPQLYRFIE